MYGSNLKGVARLQFKRRQSGQVKRRRRVRVEAPRAVGYGKGVSLSPYPTGLDPFPENLLLFDLKMEHFGAVFTDRCMCIARYCYSKSSVCSSVCL